MADSGAQACPALGPARAQYFTAAFRGHARPETMYAFALQLTGLKGSLHKGPIRCLRVIERAGKLLLKQVFVNQRFFYFLEHQTCG